MLRLTHLVVFLVACANSAEPPEAAHPAPSPPPAEPPPAPPVEPVADPTQVTPASLYASCESRVENPQTDAECTKDEECAKAGCNQEVCTTAKVAADGWNTTCEVMPCFAVLDTCGCVEGRCAWSLKDATPAEAPAAPVEPKKELPTKLPKKSAPAEGGG